MIFTAEPAAAGSKEEQEASAAVVAAPPVPPTANGNTGAAQSGMLLYIADGVLHALQFTKSDASVI